MDQAILKSHVEKPKKFKGSDFRRWQQKMLFYLTSLHVSYVLTDSEPVDPYMVDGENVPTEAQMAEYERAASQWNHNEYNCRNYILNALDDSLYDIYSTFATTIEILGIIGKEIQDSSYIRMIEKADANSIEPNPNLIGESSSKSKSNHKNKGKNGNGSGQKYSKDGKKDFTQQKNNNFKKVYHCWVCGKPGHKAKDCRHKKEHGGGNFGGNSNQANHVQSPKEFAGVIESFLTTNVVDWWYDTGCTKHICNSRRMFVSYQKVNELEPMFMGNGTEWGGMWGRSWKAGRRLWVRVGGSILKGVVVRTSVSAKVSERKDVGDVQRGNVGSGGGAKEGFNGMFNIGINVFTTGKKNHSLETKYDEQENGRTEDFRGLSTEEDQDIRRPQRHEEHIRRYDELKNLLLSLIRKSSSPMQSSRPITTMVPTKPTECAPSYGDFGCLSPNNMTDFEEDEKEFENTRSVAKEDKDEQGKEEKGVVKFFEVGTDEENNSDIVFNDVGGIVYGKGNDTWVDAGLKHGSYFLLDRIPEDDVTNRIKTGWVKWKAASGVAYITKAQANRVEVAELRMLRWTSGKTMVDMIPNGVLGVDFIIDKMREGRLRWFGHVKRRPQTAPAGELKLSLLKARGDG
ncbi:DNA polymerase zeta catalytic subunit-like protein [Tanacetum coccineum]|uniref:DNA polymerase zeta catalytic subunit-like protein n=1 Tax=Tanacetum coccineum TaxID=301880 RepID=A0ABQ5FA05_9ASTR